MSRGSPPGMKTMLTSRRPRSLTTTRRHDDATDCFLSRREKVSCDLFGRLSPVLIGATAAQCVRRSGPAVAAELSRNSWRNRSMSGGLTT